MPLKKPIKSKLRAKTFPGPGKGITWENNERIIRTRLRSFLAETDDTRLDVAMQDLIEERDKRKWGIFALALQASGQTKTAQILAFLDKVADPRNTNFLPEQREQAARILKKFRSG